jgi:hypothetical protein
MDQVDVDTIGVATIGRTSRVNVYARLVATSHVARVKPLLYRLLAGEYIAKLSAFRRVLWPTPFRAHIDARSERQARGRTTAGLSRLGTLTALSSRGRLPRHVSPCRPSLAPQPG